MADKIILKVDAESAGNRLDVWLMKSNSSWSRTAIQKAITDDYIKMNGETVKAGRKLRGGEVVEITKIEIHSEETILAEDIKLNVVYEDKSIIVIDKVSGMIVHPGAGIRTGTLVNALLFRYGKKLPIVGVDGYSRPGIVHRLDKGTSGLLVVALNEKAHKTLSLQFSERKVIKMYNAIVWGSVDDDFIVDESIKRDPVNPLRMSIKSDGRASLTEFKVVRTSSYASLLEAHPKTGRTHQIRVHLSHVNHPILGDTLYGGERERWMKRVDPLHKQKAARLADASTRVMLHASFLAFTHPINRKKMEFISPLPEDFLKAEKWVISD
jgi:23S rRNA pseudouridine1911/1915/1917 synthase